MEAVNIEASALNGFVSALRKQRHGRMHHRRRTGYGTATFVTAKVTGDSRALIRGRVTAPANCHAHYSLGFSALGSVQIVVNLEDATGTYTLERAYADIAFGIRAMMKNPNKTVMGGRDTSRLKGFYIKSTGKNSVGETGKTTLALAVAAGHISNDFREHCIAVGFTMEHF